MRHSPIQGGAFELPIEQAARVLRIDVSTLRRWIVAGCPVVTLGEVGRGKGSTVNLDQVRAWRASQLIPGMIQQSQEDTLAGIACAFEDAMKRDSAYQRVGICEAQAAGFLVLVFERMWMNVTKRSRDEISLPPQMKQLRAIYLQWAERR